MAAGRFLLLPAPPLVCRRRQLRPPSRLTPALDRCQWPPMAGSEVGAGGRDRARSGGALPTTAVLATAAVAERVSEAVSAPSYAALSAKLAFGDSQVKTVSKSDDSAAAASAARRWCHANRARGFERREYSTTPATCVSCPTACRPSQCRSRRYPLSRWHAVYRPPRLCRRVHVHHVRGHSCGW